jgi:DNA-binding protein HU-beta
MTKADLVGFIADTTETSRASADRALTSLAQAARNALQQGGRFTLPGVGTLRITQREAREGRNPRTGAKLKIAARKAVAFQASSDLKSHAQKCKVA